MRYKAKTFKVDPTVELDPREGSWMSLTQSEQAVRIMLSVPRFQTRDLYPQLWS